MGAKVFLNSVWAYLYVYVKGGVGGVNSKQI